MELRGQKLRVTKDAAEFVGIPLHTFKNLLRTSRGPTCYRPAPRLMLFAENDLVDWVAEWRQIMPKSDSPTA